MPEYSVHCDCGVVRLRFTGAPRVRAICHCDSCKELHDVPMQVLTAWNKDQLTIESGEANLASFAYPGRKLVRFFCSQCGETLFNSNRFDLRVAASTLFVKRLGSLPAGFEPEKHLFYGSRVLDVSDSLPKYLEGVDGPLFGEL